jgi:hypothetical protein
MTSFIDDPEADTFSAMSCLVWTFNRFAFLFNSFHSWVWICFPNTTETLPICHDQLCKEIIQLSLSAQSNFSFSHFHQWILRMSSRTGWKKVSTNIANVTMTKFCLLAIEFFLLPEQNIRKLGLIWSATDYNAGVSNSRPARCIFVAREHP